MANSFDFKRANKNTPNESGWCERWAEQGFGFNGLYPSAWASWRASKKRRSGKPPSDGNYYVVYFDGWWNGNHYADIAVYRNGKVWSGSDPKWRTGTSFANYKRWIGTAYLGWSEYIGTKRIATVKEKDMYKAKFEGKTQNKSAKGWFERAKHYRKRTIEEKAKVAKLTKDIKKVQADLKKALNKPPEVVVKEVEKIVEKPVEVKVGEDEAVKNFFSRLIDKVINLVKG